ncbi:MAG TPA: DUF1499 domain-containing protein [Methyloceanibacter sp.]|nr:DUF1499 domain-containing protein [Methyloceanibacter sp.]
MNYSMARYATARFSVKEAYEATWARRIALFFVQLLILTVLLHRFSLLTTPVALNLIGVSLSGLLLAIAIAVFSLVRIWFGGQTGAGQAFAAIIIACLGLAAPAFFLGQAALLPRLNDIATSPDEPLAFNTLLSQRPADANPIKDPDAAQIDAQVEAYPDLGPMVLERAAPEVFSLVNEAVERRGWTIASSETPGETGIGRIEATDQSLVMGFTDDVIVQVKGDDTHAVIDVRSVSRYGLHDLGANAARIRALFEEVTTALEKGEKTVLEQAAPKEEAAPAKKQATKKRVKKRVKKKRSTVR